MSGRAIVHGKMKPGKFVTDPRCHGSEFVSEGWNPVGDINGNRSIEDFVERWAKPGEVIIEVLGVVVEEEVTETRNFRRGDKHGSYYVVGTTEQVVVWKIDGGVSPGNHIVTNQQGECLTANFVFRPTRPTTTTTKKKVLKKVNV